MDSDKKLGLMENFYLVLESFHENPFKFFIVYILILMFLCACLDIISHDTFWLGLLLGSCFLYIGESFSTEFVILDDDDEDKDDSE